MIKLIFLTALLLFLCAFKVYSQNTSISKNTGNIKTSILKDTSKTIDKADNDSLNKYDKIRSLKVIEYNGKPEKDIYDFNYLPQLGFKKNDSEKIKQEILKRNINAFLSRQYNEIPDYDLGVIGMYLKSARKITAIILAILSL